MQPLPPTADDAIDTVPVVATQRVDKLRRDPELRLTHVLRQLRRERNGLALLQTADRRTDGSSSTERSILVTRALLRIELVAARVEIEPLEDCARQLAELVRAQLPSSVPTTPHDVADEDERLGIGSETTDSLDCLRRILAVVQNEESSEDAMPIGLFGAFGYEIVDRFENLPERAADCLEEPDYTFVLATDFVVIDHASNSVHVTTRALPWEQNSAVETRRRETLDALASGSPTPDRTRSFDQLPAPDHDLTEDEFRAGVTTIREHIENGDVFQAVLSRSTTFDLGCDGIDPLHFFEKLVERNPSPYAFYFDLGERGALCGSSPETFVRVQPESGRVRVELRPIAGTIGRGRHADGSIDHDLDGRLALAMEQDAKERAEHAMLLDLARNDIGRIAVPGTTRVLEAFVTERYRHVQHLVSRVQGELRPQLDALHAYRATANMGTLSGAPKPRAMQRIRELEASARGFYGGAAGYLLQDGQFDTAIVIRSARITANGLVTIRTGAGVVRDSTPEGELQETYAKARSCVEALAATLGCEAASSVSLRSAAVGDRVGRRSDKSPKRILVLDHADSFVFNLVDHMRRSGAEVDVLRADAPDIADSFAQYIKANGGRNPDLLLLSPGPGHPDEAPFALNLLQQEYPGPVLGVCLGHQIMARACGGSVERATRPVHGNTSKTTLNPDEPAFAGLPSVVQVARYHSLCVPASELPSCLVPVAVCPEENGPDGTPLVMAVRHRTHPWIGVQFHPESFLSALGGRLLDNILATV